MSDYFDIRATPGNTEAENWRSLYLKQKDVTKSAIAAAAQLAIRLDTVTETAREIAQVAYELMTVSVVDIRLETKIHILEQKLLTGGLQK